MLGNIIPACNIPRYQHSLERSLSNDDAHVAAGPIREPVSVQSPERVAQRLNGANDRKTDLIFAARGEKEGKLKVPIVGRCF